MNDMENEFSELVSGHLKALMTKVENQFGVDSAEYKALYYQYIRTDEEQQEMREKNQKHYEAVVNGEKEGLRYIERLYKRQATVDLTTACSAHCRYCLRQNYGQINVNEEEMSDICAYLSSDKYLKEVLITGGDPLLTSEKLICFMEKIIKYAPNIRILRIGTRLPVQNPDKLDEKLLAFFRENKDKVFFEIALQVNHAIELQSESLNCLRAIRESGVTIYAQNVLLKHVNDSMESLITLYDTMRYEHIEAHYLFHPVPIRRTAQFRMPLREFLDFARELTASGEIPGRSKPMFSVMTDVGKCTLYDGTIVGRRDDGYYEINTGYRLEERLKWNTNYVLPSSAKLSGKGTIIVDYLDGE